MYTVYSIICLKKLEKNVFHFKTESELSDWILENKIQGFSSKFYFHYINNNIPTYCTNTPQDDYYTSICIDFE